MEYASVDTDFRVGADVHCSDGPAGRLQHLVVDPASNIVTHIVVDSREYFGIPLLVPMNVVADASYERVQLQCTQAELKLMDPFEEVMSAGVQGQSGLAGEMPPMFPTPGFAGMAVTGLAGPLGTGPMAMPIMEEVVPEGEVVIGHDSTVQASDGDVGHVEDLITDPTTGRLTHLVVRSGHFWATHTFRLPVSAVEVVEEGTVRLRLTQAEVEAIAGQSDAP